jgi:hypothetical protein
MAWGPASAAFECRRLQQTKFINQRSLQARQEAGPQSRYVVTAKTCSKWKEGGSPCDDASWLPSLTLKFDT